MSMKAPILEADGRLSAPRDNDHLEPATTPEIATLVRERNEAVAALREANEIVGKWSQHMDEDMAVLRRQRDEALARVKVLEAGEKASKEDAAFKIIALFREY
jgi:hypothetical protein